MITASIGKQLRRAREVRGISLQAIAYETRLNHVYLQAIEADDYRLLTHELFRWGYIKLYARQIGFDEKEARESYERTLRGQISLNEEQDNEEEFVGFALFGNKIKIVSLARDEKYTVLDETQNLHNILYITSSETMMLQIAVEELESLVNDPKAKEKDFQEFFERYPDFILNDEYKKAHPHIVLAKNDAESFIPDFVLEPIDQSSLSDLLELKLPSAQIFVLEKKRMRFSAAVLEACAQLREYSLFFDEENNRRRVQAQYGLLAFKPKMFVIIGRRGDVSPIDVRKIESDIPNIKLRTYDDIITRVKTKVDAMKRGRVDLLRRD